MTAVRRRSAALHHLPLRIALTLATSSILSLDQCSSAVETDRILLLSGAADTVQRFHVPRATCDGSRVNLESSFVRHHLVCFHRGGGSHNYASSVAEGRTKCCNELYQSGLLGRDDRKYCTDHVAVVPTAATDAIAMGGKRNGGALGRISPVFYVSLDEDVTGSKKASSNRSYNQHRELKIYEDKERESFRDGFKGVGAYSPFHLVGFMPERPGGEAALFPLRGRLGGTLSDEGGMHRAFRQRMHLSLDSLSATAGRNYRVSANATIFFPITAGIFIDGDDPLILEYERGSREGLSCRISIAGGMVIRGSSSCSIQFLHPETIDIEQPSFASRQYVVAYQVSAMLHFSFGPSPEGVQKELEVVVDYGTTLHMRYPSPMSKTTDEAANGLVPIVIQQPSLYSASASLGYENDAKYYALRTKAENLNSSDPIVVHVAAGFDSDYWWVTAITMSSALIGGLVLIKSLDFVSTWC